MSEFTDLLSKKDYREDEKEGYGIILWILILHIIIIAIYNIYFLTTSLLGSQKSLGINFTYSLFLTPLLTFIIWNFFKRKENTPKLIILFFLVHLIFTIGKSLFFPEIIVSKYTIITVSLTSILAITFLLKSKRLERVFYNKKCRNK